MQFVYVGAGKCHFFPGPSVNFQCFAARNFQSRPNSQSSPPKATVASTPTLMQFLCSSGALHYESISSQLQCEHEMKFNQNVFNVVAAWKFYVILFENCWVLLCETKQKQSRMFSSQSRQSFALVQEMKPFYSSRVSHWNIFNSSQSDEHSNWRMLEHLAKLKLEW